MKTCDICLIQTTKVQNPLIACHKCSKLACGSCCKRYISSKFEDPTCMFCHELWTKQFVIDKFSKNYVNTEFKLHRQEVLFQREKEFFGYTMALIGKIRTEEEELKKMIVERKDLSDELKFLRAKVNNSSEAGSSWNTLILSMTDSVKKLRGAENLGETAEMLDQIRALTFTLQKTMEHGPRSEILYANNRFSSLSAKIWKKETMLQNFEKTLNVNFEESDTKFKFTIFCQKNECNGMLDRRGVCVTCSTAFCLDCLKEINKSQDEKKIDDAHEKVENQTFVKNETDIASSSSDVFAAFNNCNGNNSNVDDKEEMKTHVCLQEDIDTYKLIKSTTRPCPRCHIPINKIHGCDQMF
eukprot:Awhi_evm1s92